jgi:hypothetical protein
MFNGKASCEKGDEGNPVTFWPTQVRGRLGRSDDRPPLFRIQLAVSDKASLLNLATSLPVTPLSFSLSLA